MTALLRLYDILFVRLLRYGLPSIRNLSGFNLKDLESVQAQALRACLGLPKCTSNDGTLCEAEASRLPFSGI